ncbi:MAG: DUF3667 domain-containing protein [Flavobacteriales bacterium]|nr:DUF3667 domain-containing protein [Flavobacteriales bacterium]
MNCKNCTTALIPNSDYCHNCGAKEIRNRLTVKNLLQHIIETFFSYDNTFLKTIIYLFKDPKDVIDSYVQGVRKKYLAPLAFFAIALTISGLYFFILKQYFPNFFEMAASGFTADEKQIELTRKITQKATEFNALINFIIIPAVAALSCVLFWKQRYNYTEHLVIYFYTFSLFSIFSSILNLLVLSFFPFEFTVISTVVYIILIVYHGYVLKGLFTLSFKQLLIKILIFLPLAFVFYIGVVIAFFIISLLTGVINIQDFKPQP